MPCVPFDYGTLWAPDYSMASGNAVPTAVGSKKKKKSSMQSAATDDRRRTTTQRIRTAAAAAVVVRLDADVVRLSTYTAAHAHGETG